MKTFENLSIEDLLNNNKQFRVTYRKFISLPLPAKIFTILKIISNLNNIDVSGGNCGESAVAVYNYLNFLGDNSCNISALVSSDIKDENELFYGDIDVYHIVLKDKNKNIYYDEFGKINVNYLLKLAEDQYGDLNPQTFTFDMPSEENKIKLLLRQTNRSVSSTKFYKILEDFKLKEKL